MKHEVVEAASAAASAISISKGATYAGAGVAAAGSAFQNSFFGWAGLCVGVLGLIVSTYFQWRRDVREQRAEQAKGRRK